VKIGGMEKEARKIEEKMMFSLVCFKRENTKDGKYLGKKSTRAHKLLSSRFGRKIVKKREKRGA